MKGYKKCNRCGYFYTDELKKAREYHKGQCKKDKLRRDKDPFGLYRF